MDLETIRRELPGLMRGLAGELVTLRPMRSGKMKAAADDSRPVLSDVPARVDVWPELVQLGGGRERPSVTLAQGEYATASIERAALAWEPEQGDLLERVPAKGETLFRVSRTGDAGEGRILLYLSAAAK